MLIDVTANHPLPLPAQIAAGVRAAVADGSLTPGDAVMSTRALAAQLGVSRGTVVAAYDQLISEGYLLASQGAPTRVHPELPVASREVGGVAGLGGASASNPLLSLKPAPSAASGVRPSAWRAAWRDAAAEPGGRVDKAGQPELREAVAEHLRLTRGLNVSPGQLVVSGGSREGLLLILATLAAQTGRRLRVGVEDPGYPGLRRIVPMAGHELVECATDADGIEVEQLPDDLDAVLMTPAHLYPLGGSMPAARRAQLVAWAARTGTVVIEDDFNAELRYRTAPQPTLAAQAPRGVEVFTLGTFSTLLSQELAAGYVVASASSAESLAQTRRVLGMPVSSVTQRAVAHLLRGGYVRRNTRAMHARLAAGRDVLEKRLLPALRGMGAQAQLSGSVGADAVVSFASDKRMQEFEALLAEAGYEAGHLPRALILSFSHLNEAEFATAVDTLERLTSQA